MDSLFDFFSNTTFLFAFIFFTVLVISISIIIWFKGFSEDRQYLKMEIERSGSSGKKYWKLQLKKFYVSQIPFLGPWLCKFIKQ